MEGLEFDGRFLGHTSKDGREQLLSEHLQNVADIAGQFARKFGAESLGRFVGAAHDIGKYHLDFQKRIRGSKVKFEHSLHGAIIAKERNDLYSAFCIAGHHTGLPDAGSPRFANADGNTLFDRFHRGASPIDLCDYAGDIELPNESTPSWLSIAASEDEPFSIAFFIRMLFSCLVDADYLDTEAFMRPERVRKNIHASMVTLLDRFDTYIASWKTPLSDLNQLRSDILMRCRELGREQQGVYTLTVPTGGGKTISSLAFALEHAVTHNLDRVIYVIPYTSIIEQNAQVFREIVGYENILEHHSNVDIEFDESKANDPDILRMRLASENWDLPVVVTTSVQFFESLFAHKNSRCRKLHNIVNSVIIFDEAQMFPLEHLYPCLFGIAELNKHYGVTAVLCTATQPHVDSFLTMFNSKLQVKEITENTQQLFDAFQRTMIEEIDDQTIESLATSLTAHKQVLCIVNNRKSAQAIYDLLPEEGRFHLSTRMTPKHRRTVIEEIRNCLIHRDEGDDTTCRVISTSLIEAGVDLDFPTVYRERLGVDSILQAAGRCNRENKRPITESRVMVFRLLGSKVPKVLEKNRAATDYVLAQYSDLNGLQTIQAYFDRLRYYLGDEHAGPTATMQKHGAFDSSQVLNHHRNLNFRTCGETFAMIEQNTFTMYVPNDENKDLLERLRIHDVTRDEMRILAQSSVQIYEQELKKYERSVEKVGRDGRIQAVILLDKHQYTDEKGLIFEASMGNAIFDN